MELGLVTSNGIMKVRPRIECYDGATISVQASRGHYCTPRNDVGPYTAVEVGYPSAPFPEAAQYKESDAPDEWSVFGWVPTQLVMDWINSHGGAVD